MATLRPTQFWITPGRRNPNRRPPSSEDPNFVEGKNRHFQFGAGIKLLKGVGAGHA
ncbi:hypothetical protein SAMN05444581_107107 [Methylocapsa palsarum]|uniref:Uncharacterized protein n=1 Tax=Methylocapsa palsarum TaxID=1612308 RepID=A0A1I3Z7N6_9HYPH|nr:hypothetical protein SAMN05444581_107107 [Methylocapsa palsarum]